MVQDGEENSVERFFTAAGKFTCIRFLFLETRARKLIKGDGSHSRGHCCVGEDGRRELSRKRPKATSRMMDTFHVSTGELIIWM